MPRTGLIAAIPARYASTRLPGKPLRSIAGRPMIEHVYSRARKAPGIDEVVVLTDDERIRQAVEAFGGQVEMTPESCLSGTDRIAHAARGWQASAIVNVQGDEPLIDPAVIGRVAEHLRQYPDHPMVTLASPASDEEFDDPNAVKVVFGQSGKALYFSRARIPYPRDGENARQVPVCQVPACQVPVWKHVGIYGYQYAALFELASLEPTPLEKIESLEQLRALENGISIHVLEIEGSEPGVDTPEDLARAEARLLQNSNRPTSNP